jgi:hypothetical protein
MNSTRRKIKKILIVWKQFADKRRQGKLNMMRNSVLSMRQGRRSSLKRKRGTMKHRLRSPKLIRKLKRNRLRRMH